MYADKHIDLFEQIPFNDFYAYKPLFQKLINSRGQNIDPNFVAKCYDILGNQMFDPYNTNRQFIVRYLLQSYDFHETITKTHETIFEHRLRKTKMFNSVFKKNGYERCPHSPNGLIIKPKENVAKKDVYPLIEDFRFYSKAYQPRRDIFTKEYSVIPNDNLEYLYKLLKTLLERADFSYRHAGSVILSNEIAELLSNQSIFVYTQNLIKNGHDHDTLMQNIELHKMAMFGELRHDKEKYRQIKERLQQRQK